MKEQREMVESLRVAMVQPLLDAPSDGKPPFICLSFSEHRTGDERIVPALFVGHVPRPPFVSDLVKVSSLVLRLLTSLFPCLILNLFVPHEQHGRSFTFVGLSGSCQVKKTGRKNLKGIWMTSLRQTMMGTLMCGIT